MFISGFQKRSIADQIDTFGYEIALSLDSLFGSCQVGFSGDHATAFNFSSGKIFDPQQKFVGSYNANEQINLAGTIGQSSYDYFINGNPIALGYPCASGRNSWFFINPVNVTADVDFNISGHAPNWSGFGSGLFTGAGCDVTGWIFNQTPNVNFRVFGGEINEIDGLVGSNGAYWVKSVPSGNISNSGAIVVTSTGAQTASTTLPLRLFTNFGDIDFNFYVGVTQGAANQGQGNSGVNNFFFSLAPNAPTVNPNSTNTYTLSFSNYPSGAQIDVSLAYQSGITGQQLKQTLVTNLFASTLNGTITGEGFIQSYHTASLSQPITGHDTILNTNLSTPSGSGILSTDTLYASGPVSLDYNLQVFGQGEGIAYRDEMMSGQTTAQVSGLVPYRGLFVMATAQNVAGTGQDGATGTIVNGTGGTFLYPTGQAVIHFDLSQYSSGLLIKDQCYVGPVSFNYDIPCVGYANGGEVNGQINAEFLQHVDPGTYQIYGQDDYSTVVFASGLIPFAAFDPVYCNNNNVNALVSGLLNGYLNFNGYYDCSNFPFILPISGVPQNIFYNGSGVPNQGIYQVIPQEGFLATESSRVRATGGTTRTSISETNPARGFFDQIVRDCDFLGGWGQKLDFGAIRYSGIITEQILVETCTPTNNSPSYVSARFYVDGPSTSNVFDDYPTGDASPGYYQSLYGYVTRSGATTGTAYIPQSGAFCNWLGQTTGDTTISKSIQYAKQYYNPASYYYGSQTGPYVASTSRANETSSPVSYYVFPSGNGNNAWTYVDPSDGTTKPIPARFYNHLSGGSSPLDQTVYTQNGGAGAVCFSLDHSFDSQASASSATTVALPTGLKNLYSPSGAFQKGVSVEIRYDVSFPGQTFSGIYPIIAAKNVQQGLTLLSCYVASLGSSDNQITYPASVEYPYPKVSGKIKVDPNPINPGLTNLYFDTTVANPQLFAVDLAVANSIQDISQISNYTVMDTVSASSDPYPVSSLGITSYLRPQMPTSTQGNGFSLFITAVIDDPSHDINDVVDSWFDIKLLRTTPSIPSGYTTPYTYQSYEVTGEQFIAYADTPSNTVDSGIMNFVVDGTGATTKQFALRALAPSIQGFDNPDLILLRNGDFYAYNNDFLSNSRTKSGYFNSSSNLSLAGLNPPSTYEGAMILDLPPGSYTAITRSLPSDSSNGNEYSTCSNNPYSSYYDAAYSFAKLNLKFEFDQSSLSDMIFQTRQGSNRTIGIGWNASKVRNLLGVGTAIPSFDPSVATEQVSVSIANPLQSNLKVFSIDEECNHTLLLNTAGLPDEDLSRILGNMALNQGVATRRISGVHAPIEIVRNNNSFSTTNLTGTYYNDFCALETYQFNNTVQSGEFFIKGNSTTNVLYPDPENMRSGYNNYSRLTNPNFSYSQGSISADGYVNQFLDKFHYSGVGSQSGALAHSGTYYIINGGPMFTEQNNKGQARGFGDNRVPLYGITKVTTTSSNGGQLTYGAAYINGGYFSQRDIDFQIQLPDDCQRLRVIVETRRRNNYAVIDPQIAGSGNYTAESFMVDTPNLLGATQVSTSASNYYPHGFPLHDGYNPNTEGDVNYDGHIWHNENNINTTASGVNIPFLVASENNYDNYPSYSAPFGYLPSTVLGSPMWPNVSANYLTATNFRPYIKNTLRLAL